MLGLDSTVNKYKIGEKSFLRKRKFSFKSLAILVLMKSVKSLQIRLNEFFDRFVEGCETVSSSAFTQARRKFSYKLFVDLNKDIIVKEFYNDKSYKRYKGFRLIAIDGTRVSVPDNQETREYFNTIPTQTPSGKVGEHVRAIASVAYDVMNNIVIDSTITHSRESERALAINHLKHLGKEDLVILDRGYPSYELVSDCYDKGINFLIRCGTSWIKEISLMKNSNKESEIITLKRSRLRVQKNKTNLTDEIQLRLVKVILDSGEVEILATSLLDEELYPTEEFKRLYWQRWGVETFYGVIKGRLSLENFTGKSVESIKQDFYSTIFLSNLETILTEDAENELKKRSQNNKYKQKVNKAISFNAIKDNLFYLLCTESDIDKLIIKLNKIFIQTPVPIRPNRKFERSKGKAYQWLCFWKRNKKNVY